MNNYGWGLRVMVLFTCILLFALIFVIVEIQKGFDNLEGNLGSNDKESTDIKPTYNSYDDIEYAMIKSATSYVNKYYSKDFLENDYVTVPLKTLQNEKLIDNIIDIKDKKITCSGYVSFIKLNGVIEYDAYLKCGKKYETKGYLERLDQI